MRCASLCVACVAFVLLACAGASRASGVADLEARALEARHGVRPSVFGTERLDGRGPLPRPSDRLALSGRRLDGPPLTLADLRGETPGGLAAGGGRKRIVTAVAASALLPGLGELYLYAGSRDKSTLARVPLFFALEGYLWYSYHDNHSKGKDLKREYEAFADAHWSLERFLETHPYCAGIGGCDNWQQYNENAQSSLPYFLFTPKEADREEYYENCGKYNAFVFGWDDWAGQSDYWTPNRHAYVDLRSESDKYLVRGDQRLMGLIVSRVVSMVDAGWIAYRTSRGYSEDKGWSLHLRMYDEAPTLTISRRF